MTLNARRLAALLAAGAVLGSASMARAETVEEFYQKHPSVSILIGQATGSSYDLWSRILGKAMSKYLPGHPTFVVQPMLGAGTLVMTNYLYNQAPKDGTVIGSFSPGLPVQAVAGLENVKFDANKFTYIGSPEAADHACIISTASGVKSAEEAIQTKKEIFMGGAGPTTTNDYMPPIINELAGTNFKVISGFKSVPEIFLAMERNEVGGQCAKLDSLMAQGEQQIKAGKYVMLFNLNEKPSDVPGLHSVFDYIKTPEAKQTMRFIRSSSALGRPYVAPPDVPQDRLQALRTALQQSLKDPELMDEVKKLKYTITYTSPEDLQKMVGDLYKTPPDLLAKAKAMLPSE
jgi:tripartite-type tricarboxylate transporter receptor subunit TctC